MTSIEDFLIGITRTDEDLDPPIVNPPTPPPTRPTMPDREIGEPVSRIPYGYQRSTRDPRSAGSQGLDVQYNHGWGRTTTQGNTRNVSVLNKLLRSAAQDGQDPNNPNQGSAMDQIFGAVLGEEGTITALLRMLGINNLADIASQMPGKRQEGQEDNTPEALAVKAQIQELLSQGKPIPSHLLDQDKINSLPFIPMLGKGNEKILNSGQLEDYMNRQKDQYLEDVRYQQWLEDQAKQLDETVPEEEEPYYPYMGYGGGWNFGGGWGGGGESKKWVDWFKNLYWNVD